MATPIDFETKGQRISDTEKETASAIMGQIFNGWNDRLSYAAGQGTRDTLLNSALTKLDRFGTMLMPLNYEMGGKVFITRPKLNLSGANLKMDSLLSTLNVSNSRSINFMIRALLDTSIGGPNFSSYKERHTSFVNAAMKSPLIDFNNPFITPLCNLFTDISGLPDLILTPHTTSPGFFSEDYTMVRGSDLLNKSTEINLSFRDIQGGIAFSIIFLWVWYMGLQAKGVVKRDAMDIYARRLNYTCSIYIFLFDPSMEVLTGWCKCTGCFPLNAPSGAKFNISRGNEYLEAATKFSVPFAVNKVEYMKPEILMDFNTLMRRYNTTSFPQGLEVATPELDDNYLGLPCIVDTSRGLELKYYYDPSKKPDLTDPGSELLSRLESIQPVVEDY